jgi:hypothetical protein
MIFECLLQDLRINLNYSDPQDAEDTRGNINQAFIQVFMHHSFMQLFIPAGAASRFAPALTAAASTLVLDMYRYR